MSKADQVRELREKKFADRNARKPRDLMPGKVATSTDDLAAAIAKIKPKPARKRSKLKRKS